MEERKIAAARAAVRQQPRVEVNMVESLKSQQQNNDDGEEDDDDRDDPFDSDVTSEEDDDDLMPERE